ncbi:hypothetical protein HanXRQr2_Chr09g0418141 [Helianthus annuus]|uniref:Uncharacterized protein n=1 Tax=Helianthus annuus TaxID=4232 RepID=A0A9K3NBA6_HELAN|nr:hypothetical protein HanXRQr2_Chr09g0418141 [Helianthus annuus]KAJ0895789.1 hypothetical protein HanPSC8_Chr09g0404501 [Helianthus annuus]
MYAIATFALKLVCPRAKQITPPAMINPFAITFFEGFLDSFFLLHSSETETSGSALSPVESNESGT